MRLFQPVRLLIWTNILTSTIIPTGTTIPDSRVSVQGGLGTAFDRSDAQRRFQKLRSLAVSDSFLKLTPEAQFIIVCITKKRTE